MDAIRDSFYPRLTLTGSVGAPAPSCRRCCVDRLAPWGGAAAAICSVARHAAQRGHFREADYEVAVLGLRQTWYQALADVENALSARQQ